MSRVLAGSIAMHQIVQFIFFNMGKMFLRLVTGGKYPPQPVEERQEKIVWFAGFVVFFFLLLGLGYMKEMFQ